MNPYKVLGVTKRANDKQIKNAYRRLAKKYHPDQNIGTPDEKKAEERMKQINEAYAAILVSRKQKKMRDTQGKKKQNNIPVYCAKNSSLYQRIHQELKTDNLRMAGILLQRVSERDAEWYFLSGEVCFQKKWYEEAKQAYEKAVQANPANPEYQAALEKMKGLGNFDTPKINFRVFQSKISVLIQRRSAKNKTKI